jgi:hypothetical protein
VRENRRARRVSAARSLPVCAHGSFLHRFDHCDVQHPCAVILFPDCLHRRTQRFGRLRAFFPSLGLAQGFDRPLSLLHTFVQSGFGLCQRTHNQATCDPGDFFAVDHRGDRLATRKSFSDLLYRPFVIRSFDREQRLLSRP